MNAKWRKCSTIIAASLRDDIIWASMYQARTQHNNKRKLSKTSKKKSATNTPIEPGPTNHQQRERPAEQRHTTAGLAGAYDVSQFNIFGAWCVYAYDADDGGGSESNQVGTTDVGCIIIMWSHQSIGGNFVEEIVVLRQRFLIKVFYSCYGLKKYTHS
uniref:Uncharacterized protein n=1 Tax=Anopheles gambiae TaxID=7165 RepID=A0A453YZJ9_ANOGA